MFERLIIVFTLIIFMFCTSSCSTTEETDSQDVINDAVDIDETDQVKPIMKKIETTDELIIDAIIDYEGKFEVGFYELSCVLTNLSDSKSFETRYCLNNNFNKLLQFYMLKDGKPIEEPEPVSVKYPLSALPSDFNMPFSGQPDVIKPGKSMKMLERAIGFKEPGFYVIWFTLFLPNDKTNIEDFANNEMGTTLQSNVIRINIK